jgi:hypothetical protein
MMQDNPQLDHLSGWALPPASAEDAEPVRVFDTAEAALAFLAATALDEAPAGKRAGRRLMSVPA